ncbi:MAG: hypothetical protein IPK33_26565 [Gemmatimonadetes bacterium]|nr:hypothetical protein [Gemmatimonadota bacterium]
MTSRTRTIVSGVMTSCRESPLPSRTMKPSRAAPQARSWSRTTRAPLSALPTLARALPNVRSRISPIWFCDGFSKDESTCDSGGDIREKSG